ncbi:unnamed protein product [Rotaria sp. Silwood2]|nr:unnamed protein product [Rotaria sp. Silwood2]CAF2546267.1 unnamed protein product [Rotaria sp. Silwood2]CAF4332095.1 unnamed protein product [Rotaria sp. Silwood2]CAF4465498.1 unnamed protein product [Rotaria sp. Silwood2]
MEFAESEKEKYAHSISLGDFLFYNLMVLFVLPPVSSIEMKICIGIGCIIFIEIGYILTIWIGTFMKFWNAIEDGPALPLPVIAFSAYFILANVFIEDSNRNLCEYLELSNYR